LILGQARVINIPTISGTITVDLNKNTDAETLSCKKRKLDTEKRCNPFQIGNTATRIPGQSQILDLKEELFRMLEPHQDKPGIRTESAEIEIGPDFDGNRAMDDSVNPGQSNGITIILAKSDSLKIGQSSWKDNYDFLSRMMSSGRNPKMLIYLKYKWRTEPEFFAQFRLVSLSSTTGLKPDSNPSSSA